MGTLRKAAGSLGLRDGLSINPEQVQETLVHRFLEESAQRMPRKTALVCGDGRFTFAQINSAANCLAQGLIADGIKPGDRVAVYLENSVESVIAIFGILKAGAVLTLINAATKADKLGYILYDERATVLITVNDTLRRRVVHEILPTTSVPIIIWVDGIPAGHVPVTTRLRAWDRLLATGHDETPDRSTTDQQLASIMYTSGATGIPKGVMSAHHDMVFAARSIATLLENSAADVIFCSLSLASTYGLYQLLTAALVGATLVLEKNFILPHRALEVMVREQVTGFPGVPTMFALLLGLKNLENHDLRSLRYVTSTTAPLPVHHILALRATFPNASLFSMYGQIECKRACYLPPEQLDARPDSVGIPIPGTEVLLLDKHGKSSPPGAVGELVVRGPHLMRGYWEKPEDTAKQLRPSAVPGELDLYTGDLFRRDADGFLYFVGREDDIIKSRGEKVSPKEIENTLYGLAGVREVAAAGIPDEILGEAIVVFIVLERGATLTESEVRAHCARCLEDFMVPKYVEFRLTLPKGSKHFSGELKARLA